jgi:hypothetical protein
MRNPKQIRKLLVNPFFEVLWLEKPDFHNRRSATCGEGAAGSYLPDRAGLKPRQAIVWCVQIACHILTPYVLPFRQRARYAFFPQVADLRL